MDFIFRITFFPETFLINGFDVVVDEHLMYDLTKGIISILSKSREISRRKLLIFDFFSSLGFFSL